MEGGYTWEIPAGPMAIRYRAVITGGTWTETGDRIMPGRDPVRFFEMLLTRLGDTDWPTAGAVAPPAARSRRGASGPPSSVFARFLQVRFEVSDQALGEGQARARLVE